MKVLFYIAKRYSIPIIHPLVSALSETDNEWAFYVSRKAADALPESWKSSPISEELKSAVDWRPDFVLCPGNFVDFRLPGVKVQLFHGVGIEKPSHFHIRHFFDVYLTSGPAVTKPFEEKAAKYGYFLVYETGWPKIDYILNYDRSELRRHFNIPEGKKVILYAPTHSRKMESASALLPVLPNVVRDDEIWLIKFHELMDPEVRGLKAEIPGAVRVVTDSDITPYLHLAEVLVSDTSSVVYEFMALDKPAVTFRARERRDKAIDIQDPESLRGAVDRCLAHPEEYSDNRMRHLKEVNPYLDGRTGQRVLEALEAVARTGLPDRRKPGNWFRKAQILYHSRFRKGYLR